MTRYSVLPIVRQCKHCKNKYYNYDYNDNGLCGDCQHTESERNTLLAQNSRINKKEVKKNEKNN